jgi:hypothetical protein
VGILGLCGGALAVLEAYQMPWRSYDSMEPHDNVQLPSDWNEKTEWVFGRLMFPNHPNAMFGRFRRGGGRAHWLEGASSWTQDYPRADRHFAQALRRLTRIHTRSVEQPVNLNDGDDVYNWPFLFAGELGDWMLDDQQCAKLRDYLLRGGFLFLDDFWGDEEWDRFNETMRKVFPDRPIVEIDGDDPIFHTVYDLEERYQVPGQWVLRGAMRWRSQGAKAKFQGIYDDSGRVMVAITYNSDVGDGWEWADDPGFPERYASFAMRLGVNYVIYSLTH